ncbi:MAG: flagellin [Solirubrobacteraceae bacterium]
MSLRIQTNTDALGSYNNLNKTSAAVSSSMAKLSSGYRINSAADDTAGLSISERMRGQIRGLAQASNNIGDATSFVQTAEANLSTVHDMLQRVRELAVQYQNGSLATADKTAIQSEVNQLASEIGRIGTSAKFNGIGLLNSTATVSFQVGANDGETITVTSISLAATVGTLFASLGSSGTDLSEIDAAINAVSDQRAVFGATQNRLQFAAQATTAYHENLVTAESRIRDVDMASEMVKLTKNQVLAQAGTSMLAQANQSGQGVLKLLQ